MMKARFTNSILFVVVMLAIGFPLYHFFIDTNEAINDRRQIDKFYTPKTELWDQGKLKQGFSVDEFEEHGIIDFGFRPDTLVVVFDLSPYLENMEIEEVLEITNPSFRSVVLYRVNTSGELVRMADEGLGGKNSKLYNNPNPLFKLKASEKWLPYVVLKISSSERIRFNAVISPHTTFLHNLNKRLIFISMYVGIMLALFFYNVFLYFSVRDKLYLSYSMYILFIALAQLSLSGHSYFFFLYSKPMLFEISIVVFSVIAGGIGVSFVRVFLKTKERVPILDQVLRIIMWFYFLIVPIRLVGMVALSYSMTDIAGLLGVVTVFLTAFILVVRKIRSAYFFLLGWSFFLIGVVIYIVQSQSQIDIEYYSNLPMLIGTALEAVLLSLALADTINTLKKEKAKEQSERLLILAENEQLVREQNFMLEEKVRLRTDELEQALKNLQNTQSQLVSQEKMASLGQLTAGVAHEINNPINFVSSNIGPLKRDIKDILEIIDFYRDKGSSEFSPESLKEAKQLEEDLELDYLLEEIDQLLKGMDEGARRTVEIVKGLRLFSRVDEQDVKKVDLHVGLESTLILLKSSIPSKVQIQKDYGELPLVECLAGKINQVFMNILTNSVFALTEHLNTIAEPKIILRTRAFSDKVTIEIEDNGPGIPEAIKERIFEPFFTTKAIGKGTGLGLSIVYSIIENHKGHLEVISEENQGTNFKITLPIYQRTNSYES